MMDVGHIGGWYEAYGARTSKIGFRATPKRKRCHTREDPESQVWAQGWGSKAGDWAVLTL